MQSLHVEVPPTIPGLRILSDDPECAITQLIDLEEIRRELGTPAAELEVEAGEQETLLPESEVSPPVPQARPARTLRGGLRRLRGGTPLYLAAGVALFVSGAVLSRAPGRGGETAAIPERPAELILAEQSSAHGPEPTLDEEGRALLSDDLRLVEAKLEESQVRSGGLWEARALVLRHGDRCAGASADEPLCQELAQRRTEIDQALNTAWRALYFEYQRATALGNQRAAHQAVSRIVRLIPDTRDERHEEARALERKLRPRKKRGRGVL